MVFILNSRHWRSFSFSFFNVKIRFDFICLDFFLLMLSLEIHTLWMFPALSAHLAKELLIYVINFYCSPLTKWNYFFLYLWWALQNEESLVFSIEFKYQKLFIIDISIQTLAFYKTEHLEIKIAALGSLLVVWAHSFTKCTKFSEKLLFLTLFYVRVRMGDKNVSFSEKCACVLN